MNDECTQAPVRAIELVSVMPLIALRQFLHFLMLTGMFT